MPPKKNQNNKDQAAEGTIPAELKRRREKQRKALLQAQTPSEEEKEVKKTAENLRSSEALGIAEVKEQPIAQDFIRGQAAGIRRQTQAQLEPLQRRLSRLQKERQQKAETARKKLEFTREDISEREEEQEALAKRQREKRQRIRDIATQAAERGASEDVVRKITGAQTEDEALQLSAQFAPVEQETEDRFETRSVAGGGILQLEKDPETGEVINTKVLRQPEQDAPDTEIIETGGKQKLVNTQTGEVIRDLGAVEGDDRQTEFDLAREFVRQNKDTMSRAQLEADLRANSDLDPGDIDAVLKAEEVQSREERQEVQVKARQEAEDILADLINPNIFASRERELAAAKRRAIEKVENQGIESILPRRKLFTDKQKQLIEQELKNMPVDAQTGQFIVDLKTGNTS